MKYGRSKIIGVGGIITAIIGASIYITVITRNSNGCVFTAGANVYMCPSGSDSNSGTMSSPVKSMNKAYQLAPQPSVIQVGCGTYSGSQTIAFSSSKTLSSHVVFAPAMNSPGCWQNNGSVTVNACHVTINGVVLPSTAQSFSNHLFMNSPACDVLWDGVSAPKFDFADANGWTIQNSNLGACDASFSPGWSSGGDCNSRIFDSVAHPGTENILNDNFHDYGVDVNTILDAQGQPPHSGCLEIFGANNVNVKNSSFIRCSDSASILLQRNQGSGYRITNFNFIGNYVGAVFPNDLFNKVKGSGLDTERCNTDCAGVWNISWNTFDGSQSIPWIGPSISPNMTSSTEVGNMGQNSVVGPGGCPTGNVTYDYNAYVPHSPFGYTTACGTHQIDLSPTAVNYVLPILGTVGTYQVNPSGTYTGNDPTNPDYNLNPASSVYSMVHNVVPTSVAGGCPTTDINGSLRGLSGFCSVGVSEPLRFLASNGTDSGSCLTLATACVSFDYTYHHSQPGDNVQVQCGNYGTQTFTNDSSKSGSTAYIVYHPPAGQPKACWNQTAPIKFGCDTLNVCPGTTTGPSYIELTNLAFNGGIANAITSSTVDYAVLTYQRADHLIINGQNGGRFDVVGSTNVTIQNSDVGNCTPTGASGNDFCLTRLLSGASTINILNNKIHGIRENSGGDPTCTPNPPGVCHTVGIAIFGAANVKLDGNEFYDNDVTNIRLQATCGNACINSNITIQNNWFGIPNAFGHPDLTHEAISVDSVVDNGLVIRFNSFGVWYNANTGKVAGGITCTASNDNDNTGTGTNCGSNSVHAKIYGNLLSRANCSNTNTDWSYNVFSPFSAFNGTTACDPTEVKVPVFNTTNFASEFPYVSDPVTGEPDYHIIGSSWVGDSLVPIASVSGVPPTDFTGVAMPTSGNVDAGSVQR